MTVLRRLWPLCVLILAGGCGKSTAYWTEQLKSANSAERLHAVHALQQKVQEADVVVPVLMEGLHDADTFVRRDTARALGNFGPTANKAVPSLLKAMRDKEPSVRKAAAQSLKKIDPEAATKAGVR